MVGRQRRGLGRIVRAGDGATVRLERDFAATPDEVWQMLTEPDQLATWLQASVTLEPHAGGAITLRFTNTGTTIHGRIGRFDAPTVLEYTWRAADEPESVVRFVLQPTADGVGTRLSLTHSCRVDDHANLFAAGWHLHLDLLAAQLAGQPVAWDWAQFEEVYTRYGP